MDIGLIFLIVVGIVIVVSVVLTVRKPPLYWIITSLLPVRRKSNSDGMKEQRKAALEDILQPTPTTRDGEPDWPKMTDRQIGDALMGGKVVPEDVLEPWIERQEGRKRESPTPASPIQQQPARGGVEEQVTPPPSNKPAPPPPAPAVSIPPAPQPIPAGPPKPIVQPPAPPPAVRPGATIPPAPVPTSPDLKPIDADEAEGGETPDWLEAELDDLVSAEPEPLPATETPYQPTTPGTFPPPTPPPAELEESEAPPTFIPEPLPSAPITPGGFGGIATPTVGHGQQVEFSAYYPKEIVPDKWEKLHAYIFRQLAAGAVEDDANQQMGERKAEFRGVRMPATANVPEGALVTATPHMDGFQFNPPSVSLGFYKDWHRFDFEVRVKDAPMHHSINGILTFSVEGIIVADVPLSIFVDDTAWEFNNYRTSSTAKLYQAIFCSYSHRDTTIVTRAERAYKALGLDYLRDVISLKSGQEWSDELLELIGRADIFQLFWSNAAADSEHVRFEWEHALKLSGGRPQFLRPVYWEDPKPPIPPELKHIHFAYQPDLGQ